MEGGIENSNHGDAAHNVAAGIDADDVRGIVQGSEGGALLESRHDLIGDEDGGGKLLAAVDDAVANSVDFLHGGNNAVLGAGELVDDRGDSLGVGGQGDILVKHGLAADKRAVLEVTVDADTLAETLCH